MKRTRKEDLHKPAAREQFYRDTFTGYDFDRAMIRIAAMNSYMHGFDQPNITYRDSLGELPTHEQELYDVILANPPFAGSLDAERVDPAIRKIANTKKTELLFLTMPLGQIIFDLFDSLKLRTKVYASLNYEEAGEQGANLVKVHILLNGEPVDAFFAIVHLDFGQWYRIGMIKKLKEFIPCWKFEVPIQAASGTKIIARENFTSCEKTFGPNATVVTFPRSINCWKRKKKVKAHEIRRPGICATGSIRCSTENE